MKCDAKIINRMKRIQGQLNGVLNMMQNEQSCIDVSTQLKAIKSSISKVMSLVATTNLIQTIEKDFKIELTNIDEAVDILLKNA
ncbi:MAG: metal-sensing transcriptional repressor [Acholeplasma sp.]